MKTSIPMSSEQPTIEFWFDLASMYSYLSVMRIDALAQRAGVAVRWEPVLLGPIFEAFGWKSSPFVVQQEKGDYVWKDLDRQCRKYNLPWKRPSVFPQNTVLPVRVALHGALEPWGPAFCKELMLRNWARDEDISSVESVTAALESLGLPAPSILAQVQDPVNKPKLRAQVDRARGLKIFGAPTFFVRGEMFWGNDRLEDALGFSLASV
jgi:2-hydroxychromene-2-carboxylate isomerase